MVEEKILPSAPGAPLDSATTVLLRQAAGGGCEVFLIRRSRAQAFMGGAYVFPGGKLDEKDADPALAKCCRLQARPERELLQEPGLGEDMARGLMLCAARELFEEAGVLLAYDSSGNFLDLQGEARARFEGYRRELHDGNTSLAALASREGLTYALDRLAPWAHWITPAIEKKRFNTRFLLALLPPGQEPAHDRVELTDSIWLTPREAIERHRRDTLHLMPPTIKTLLEIGAHDTPAALFRAAEKREVPTIQLQGVLIEGGFGVLLPHDPDYAIPDFKQTPRPGEISRLVCRGGKWSY